MGIALTECRKYLEDRYRASLKLQTGFSERIVERSPAWLPVSLENLGRLRKGTSEAAVLVDPDIGTLVYFIEYSHDQDVVKLIVQALALRSKLLLGAVEPQKVPIQDQMGSWRVALYWLVEDPKLFLSWEKAVAQLRTDAPHMEEIPVDAICKEEKGWQDAFKRHRIPRLLLGLRHVMHIKKRADVERWSAADAQVEDGLKAFSSKFAEKDQRLIAEQVEQKVSELKSFIAAGNSPSVITFRKPPNSIGARNFRNVRDATIELGSQSVACTVVTGPNGSGKSTLFEAISLAMFACSSRYLDFLRDVDANSKSPASDYVAKYLVNINQQWGTPELLVDGKSEKVIIPASKDEALERERETDGSLLSQERSAIFCRRSAAELGAEVLRGYSDLANGVQWFVEDAYQKVNTERQELLRSLGLRANITKVETAHQKVAERRLGDALAFSAVELMNWLSISASEFADFLPGADRALRLWQNWDAESRRADVASQCVLLLEESLAKNSIEQWLLEYNVCIQETTKVLGAHILDLYNAIRSGTAVTDQLKLWGEWLEQQALGSKDRAEADAMVVAKKELDALTSRQSQVVKSGALMRARLDHLLSAKSTIVQRWTDQRDDKCITCDSELSARGGFGKVVEDVFQATAGERDRLETEYKQITSTMRAVNDRLSQLGVAPNPMDAEQQSFLVRIFSPLLPDGVTLETMVRSQFSRDRLIGFALHLRSLPSIPQPIDATQRSEEVGKAIVEQSLRVSVVFDAPNNWSTIRKRLSEILGDVVKSHLPNTLEALWLELVVNLTAAPWQLRQRPSFHVRTRRNEQTLTIRVGSSEDSPLARHILNQAEVHVLGLSWFLLRYVTFGRFTSPMVMMDDPAQQMDQTTYRDLCRLLETLVRVHRVESVPLQLIVMFHQEDRAQDAARALSASLNILSWSETQTSQSITRLKVLSDSPSIAPASVLA
ncbi:MAG: hypothetical protein QOD26_3189 [Betaproteobacteria bacterium]|nr:hypothetical protein [Betaproteobacteria bacterium]